MSTKAVGWAFDQQVGDATRKLILLAFAEHANAHSWVSWPAKATVGTFAEIDPRTVQRHVKKLVESGFICKVAIDDLDDEDRERYERIPMNLRPNLYLVNPPQQGRQVVSPRGDAPVTPRGDNEANQGRQQGRQIVSLSRNQNRNIQNGPDSDSVEPHYLTPAETAAALAAVAPAEPVDPAEAVAALRQSINTGAPLSDQAAQSLGIERGITFSVADIDEMTDETETGYVLDDTFTDDLEAAS